MDGDAPADKEAEGDDDVEGVPEGVACGVLLVVGVGCNGICHSTKMSLNAEPWP